MAKSLFSPSWHRVALLSPKLRSHVYIHRHHYRGELWYVLQDFTTQRSHRFNTEANYIISLMDGQHTVQQIWDIAIQKLGDDAPTQEEIIRLLSQLHNADALQCDVSPDTNELFRRYSKSKRQSWTKKIMNPMALRFPLFDPDKFLVPTLKYVKPIFSLTGALIWLSVVISAIVLAGTHWPELTNNVTDRVLAPENLLLIWLIFPIIKALHEFGHAYATRIWNGEVHEMGLMFLVLMPIPYVDASAASTFRERYKRVIVGSAGMLVEVFLAAIAMFVWVMVEPGLVRSIAYNVILIASVSTIIFNANPLLRFDGYYILADLIEIQNLASRSTKYMGYLAKRYLFKLHEVEMPNSTKEERRWFVGFSTLSFLYRMFVVLAIATFVAGKFFFIGIVLAIWAVTMMVILPLVKSLHSLITTQKSGAQQVRVMTTLTILVISIVTFALYFPMPSWTRTEGVVWVSGDAVVRAGADGFVERVLYDPGSYVRKDDFLIACRNRELEADFKLEEGKVNELEARYLAAQVSDKVQARIIRNELATSRKSLLKVKHELENLIVTSKTDGILVIPKAQDLPGRYLKKGEHLAYILNDEAVTVRVVVEQAYIDIVRKQTHGIEVRLADRIIQVTNAVIRYEAPGATDKLPSMALSRQGGGNIATDPTDGDPTKSFTKFFMLDLEIPETYQNMHIGSRVYVRFDHGFESIYTQLYRTVRQLFLREFNV